MSTDPELRSVALVTNYVDAHRGQLIQRAEQVQQLQRLAEDHILGYNKTYSLPNARERKKSYFEQHDGESLLATISSVVSNNDLKEQRFHTADIDQAVLTYFQNGTDIFTQDYFGKIYGVLVDMGQNIASRRNMPKRRRPTLKPSEQSTTDHGILERSVKAQTEEHTGESPGVNARGVAQSAFEVAEDADNQVSPGRVGNREEVQQKDETSSGNDRSADDDQGRPPSADHNPGSKVDREHDVSNHEDLLDTELGDILRTIHSCIGIAVTELLADGANDQTAFLNMKPTKVLENLYETAFGKNWHTDMTLMVTRSQLTIADSVRSLIWAFVVGEVEAEIALFDSLQSLCDRDGAVRRYITPLLAEEGIDFNEICSRAIIKQFQDSTFNEKTIQPAIYELANQVCMILNGHIGLLHKSFIHNHWHARFMPPLRDVLEWMLKLRVKMDAAPRKHSFAMYDYGKPFSSDEMAAESGLEGDIVGFTTMPGIRRQGIDAAEVVVKAEVRLTTN